MKDRDFNVYFEKQASEKRFYVLFSSYGIKSRDKFHKFLYASRTMTELAHVIMDYAGRADQHVVRSEIPQRESPRIRILPLTGHVDMTTAEASKLRTLTPREMRALANELRKALSGK